MKRFYIKNNSKKSFEEQLQSFVEEVEIRPQKDLWASMESEILLLNQDLKRQSYIKKLEIWSRWVTISSVFLLFCFLSYQNNYPVLEASEKTTTSHKIEKEIEVPSSNKDNSDQVLTNSGLSNTNPLILDQKMKKPSFSQEFTDNNKMIDGIENTFKSHTVTNATVYKMDSLSPSILDSSEVIKVTNEALFVTPQSVTLFTQPNVNVLSLQAIPKEENKTIKKRWFKLSYQQLFSDDILNKNYQAYTDEYMLAHSGSAQMTEGLFEKLEEQAQNQFSFLIDLRFGQEFKQRFFWEAGIQFIQMQNQFRTNAIYHDELGNAHHFAGDLLEADISNPVLFAQVNNLSQTDIELTDLNQHQAASIQEKVNYLSVPLAVGINLYQKSKLSFQASAGVAPNLLTSIRTEDNPQNANHWSVSYQLQAELNYALHPKWSIVLQGQYQDILYNPQNLNPYISPNLKSFGIGVGLKYYLNKK